MNCELRKTTLLLLSLMFFAVACNNKNISPTPVNAQGNYNHSLQVGQANLMVEIADTQAAMSQGLSDRPSLQQDQGMLFNFDSLNYSASGTYPSFWMKDMNFNLDFIWIFKNKVIGVTPNVPAPTDKLTNRSTDRLPSYFPPSRVDWVVEVNAGWAKKNNINVGDVANLIDKN